MFRQLREDIAIVKEKDPAARSSFEILLTYSGLKAVRSYRRAHWFYQHKFYTIALLRCSIHLSVILYSTIIICDFGGFVNEFFVAQNDFLPAAYFASSSLQVCRIPAPWSAT